jgi:hypothetical protein
MDFEGWMHENARVARDSAHQRDTKLDVAEIQVAGSLLNTHAKPSTEERAADKAIKAGETDRTERLTDAIRVSFLST